MKHIFLPYLPFAIVSLLLNSAPIFSQNLDSEFEKATKQKLELTDSNNQLRRLSLVLRGTIPTLEELEEFNKLPESSRREIYAAKFLKSSEFAEYWTDYFGSLFREKTSNWKEPNGAFYKYIAESLHKNIGYDQMVKELLTATGRTDQKPQTLYYARDNADPLQMAEYVSRAFLGTKLSCARCHDHPFEKDFTQKDYYALASFFSQRWIRWNNSKEWLHWNLRANLPKEYRDEYNKKNWEWNKANWDKWNEAQRKAFNEKFKLEFKEVVFESELGVRFPDKPEEQGGILVNPKLPFTKEEVNLPKNADRAEYFANWLVSKDNTRFRKVIVNRLFTKVMGSSFFTPLDDWKSDTKIANSELLDFLEKEFLRLGYKPKDFLYRLVTSRAFHRKTATEISNADSLAFYVPKRMDSNQLMNSLIRGSQIGKIPHIWERSLNLFSNKSIPNLNGVGQVSEPKKEQKDFGKACEVNRPSHINTFLAIFGSGDRDDIDDNHYDVITIEQIFTMMNGRMTGFASWEGGKKNAYFSQQFEKNKNMMETINLAFLALLSRPMSPEERAKIERRSFSRLGPKDREFKEQIMQDILWAIINSREFQYVQ